MAETGNIDSDRYQRQVILKGFGENAQKKLFNAKVLVIGAGGMGCPALLCLVAASTGTVGIIDDDVILLSNLHRQILYKSADVGHPKAETAARHLKELNPDINIAFYSERLTRHNVLELLNRYDVIVDGSDNFATRYRVNDACVLLNKSLVFGAVSQYEGHLAVFSGKKDKNTIPVNYSDLFPDPPGDNEVFNCAEAGVPGVLTGIIGNMMANETIKLITGTGESLCNKLLTCNALNNQFYEVSINPLPVTALLIPGNEETFRQTDYEWLCSSHITDERKSVWTNLIVG